MKLIARKNDCSGDRSRIAYRQYLEISVHLGDDPTRRKFTSTTCTLRRGSNCPRDRDSGCIWLLLNCSQHHPGGVFLAPENDILESKGDDVHRLI